MTEGAAAGTAADETARAEQAEQADRRIGFRRYAPVLAIAAGLLLGYAFGLHHYLSLDYLAQQRDGMRTLVAEAPIAAPLIFAVLYALAVAFSFPAASILTIFSGFLFGWCLGGVVAICAATTGATLLFLAARTAFGGFLRRRVGSWGARLAEGFRANAFGYLLVLRLAPFIPFVAVNIAPALFDVRLRTFVAATLLGIMPAAFAYAWLGEGVDSVLVAAKASGRNVGLADLVTPELTIAFGALAAVAAVAALVKRRWSAPAAAA